MAKSIFVKLTTLGADINFVNLYQNSDGYSTIISPSPVDYLSIQTGILIEVDDATTIIRVMPTEGCTGNFLDITIQSEVPVTTTTTTTAPATYYIGLTSSSACSTTNNGIPLTNVSFTGSTYCDYTTLNATEIPSLSNGTYYVSDGINVRAWTKTSTPSNLYNPSVCSSCPTTTTTILS